MFRVLALTLAMSPVYAATAQDCDGLGLTNDYLKTHFCAQLQDLIPAEKTRGMDDQSDPQTGNPALSEWADIEVLQDAYRADPRKTLELIKRIKSAGGLPES